ncbi:hypothetical protein [Tuwongella immobilis]|uniref:Uncharacterized protein n=1 Tax=Tuwongella immobilis TaxID=692036 RepID=A0A6C2YH79_9BACT|nr:hypothetical protein [Tuwongella immobilis]VIP00619.1 unnamed protein product [Tuwongella immobilis]VTR96656.1 unnamed protein product [Tuwongella immobilis]
MSRVELTYAGEKYKDEVWTLKRVRSGLVLLDHEGVVVTRIPAAEASSRIELPSFLESTPFLTIMGKKRGHMFKATRAEARDVKAMIKDCIEQAPEGAAEECISRAKNTLKYGGPFFGFGILLFVAGLSGSQRALIAGIMGVLFGLIQFARAAIFYFRAQALRAKAQSNDDDDDTDEE